MIKEHYDICILTVISVELEAALAVFKIDPLNRYTREKDEKGYIYYKGFIHNHWDDREYSFILANIGSAGNYSTAATTTHFISMFSPKICFLVGIAAGVRDKIKIGEVILSNKILDYERKALVRKLNQPDTEILPEFNVNQPSFSVKQDIAHYNPSKERLKNLFKSINGTFPKAKKEEIDKKKEEFNKHVSKEILFRNSTIASGEKLLKDPTILGELRESVDRKTDGGEMEAAGFYTACHQGNTNWLVVRGISDFGDEFKDDSFHKFASQAAMTVLRDFIEFGIQLNSTESLNKGSENLKPTFSHINQLKDELDRYYNPARNNTKFDLRVSLCDTYDDINIKNYSETNIKPEKLLEKSKFKKLLLHASGGSGKTSIMFDIAKAAIQANEIVFFFDCKSGNSALQTESISMELLFNEFSIAGVIENYQNSIDQDSTILLLVDGLNEVYSTTSENILKLLESEAKRNPRLRIIAADRMNAHSDIRFERGTVDPLTEKQINDSLTSVDATLSDEEAVRQLLSIPFFLDLQLQLYQEIVNEKILSKPVLARKEMFIRYFTDIAKLTDEELKKSAEAAYRAYEEYKSRVFDEVWWESNTSTQIVRKLEETGVILSISPINKGKKNFRHQLLHDFLAGYFLSYNKELWSPTDFDVVTFQANSYEPISFATELLESEADELLIQVFNWSYMIVDKCIRDLKRSLTKSPVSNDLEFAIMVKNAEKMFEIFEDTCIGAKRRLSESDNKIARTLLKFVFKEELFDFVKNYEPSTKDFTEWKECFLLSPRMIEQKDLLLLENKNPLISWTATNSLRRMEFSKTIEDSVRMVYLIKKDACDNPLRWRIAHLLGRFPSRSNIDLLFTVLTEDSYEWARYGAVRSLMEIAFMSKDFRDEIISELISKLPQIKSPLTLKEIRRTCLITETDKNWYKTVLELAKVAATLQNDESMKKLWDDLLNEIQKRTV